MGKCCVRSEQISFIRRSGICQICHDILSFIFKSEYFSLCQENVTLIKEINDLRRELKVTRTQVHDLEATLGTNRANKAAAVNKAGRRLDTAATSELQLYLKISLSMSICLILT